MADDDKHKGWYGRGAHSHGPGLTYEEALAADLKRREEAAERDAKTGMPTRRKPGRRRKFGGNR